MPSDPNIILGLNPVAPPANPLATIGALSQLRSASVENSLRQQQITQSQAATANIQQEADQKRRENLAYNTLGDKMKDPSVAGRVGEGNFADIDSLGLDPRIVNTFKSNVLTLQKGKAELGTAQQTLND